jgi:hypothetical protein
MKISWKKSTKFKPQVILDRISAIRTVDANGKISFAGFELHDALPALRSMLHFPEPFDEVDKDLIVRTSVGRFTGALNTETFIKEINARYVALVSIEEVRFFMLTSLSLLPPDRKMRRLIESATVELVGNFYPRKFRDSKAEAERLHIRLEEESNYCKVVISVKAKSTLGAATKALRIVDILRGVWCLLGNSRMQIIGHEWTPINAVRLGQIHSVHQQSGELAPNPIWYEPNYVKATCFSPSDPSLFEKRSSTLIRKLYRSTYSKKLINCLLLYVRALDEKDQNTAFVKLWGALEALASPDVANYDLIIKRCKFLFKEAEYHEQILEHLREYRNQTVHSGDKSELARTYCYQLQFYFSSLFFFHINNSGSVRNSVCEAV